jgi:UDP-2,4-diacetamido-2,4,6-trideoxy-beta-L-altropyranose hydrolase
MSGAGACDRTLYVRVDASTAIGVGHFMRCLALAQHWLDTGGRVRFIGRFPASLEARLGEEGIAHTAIADSHPAERDLETTLATIPPAAIIVVDGYHFDVAYQTALAARGRLLVVDDMGARQYAGYALLNQNLGADTIDYGQAPAIRLLGPRYALLRREFRRLAGAPRDFARPATRVLVTLGGGDERNVTALALEALARSRHEDLEIRVLVGPANPFAASLRETSSGRPSIAIVEHSPDVAEEMRRADVAIAAAGTSAWELAVTGVPSVLIAIADNQLPTAAALDARGAAVSAGPAATLDAGALQQAVDELIDSPDRRQYLSRAASALVDGDGVVRVTEVLKGENA